MSIDIYKNLLPNTDNSLNIGSPAARFKDVHTVTISSTDISIGSGNLTTSGKIINGTYSGTVAQILTSPLIIHLSNTPKLLTGNTRVYPIIPFPFTLKQLTMVSSATAGAILTLDIWVDTIANGLPTDADSLFDTATEPSLNNAVSVSTTSFDATQFSAYQVMGFNIDTATGTIPDVTITIEFIKG